MCEHVFRCFGFRYFVQKIIFCSPLVGICEKRFGSFACKGEAQSKQRREKTALSRPKKGSALAKEKNLLASWDVVLLVARGGGGRSQMVCDDGPLMVDCDAMHEQGIRKARDHRVVRILKFRGGLCN